MANSYSAIHLEPGSTVTAKLVQVSGSTWANISVRTGSETNEFTLFGTPEQLSDLARQLDRAAILLQHDLETFAPEPEPEAARVTLAPEDSGQAPVQATSGPGRAV